MAWLRGVAVAVALLAALWAVAGSAQERLALALVEAGAERLVVGWSWQGEEEPAAFSVHWRLRVSGQTWEAAETAGSARQFAITGLRPESAYIVRVRALDERGKGIRVTGGRLYDLRAVFDTTRLPAPAAPRVAFDGERATAAWDTVDGATGYELAWGAADGDAAAERLDADALEFETGALTAGTRYEFRLRSLHGRRWSALSDAATLTPAAWPHDAPRARFQFHRAAGMFVEWDAVDGAGNYVVAWAKEGDESRTDEIAATGTSVLATREGGFFSGTWLLRVRVASAGMWSQATRVQVQSPAPELAIEMESSRELCTEGTLTEIHWSAAGGAGTLSLQINSEPVGQLHGTAKINCGMIPRDENGEIDESQRDAVITGFLRDGRGAVQHASIRVPRVEALPAPTGLNLLENDGELTLIWDALPVGQRSINAQGKSIYLIRWRRDSDSTSQYSSRFFSDRERFSAVAVIGEPGTTYALSVAALRHPFESETPEALQWSTDFSRTLIHPPENVSVTATHDTLTVAFDGQTSPEASWTGIRIKGPNGRLSRPIYTNSTAGRYQETFGNLAPATDYVVEVYIMQSEAPSPTTTVTARTNDAPADWVNRPVGPQNVRTQVTHDTIIVRWDAPHPDAEQKWLVDIEEAETGRPIDLGQTLGRGELTEVRYTGLSPATEYSIQIRHLGINYAVVPILVTTEPEPQGSTEGGASGSQGIPEPGELVISRIFDWPLRASLRSAV